MHAGGHSRFNDRVRLVTSLFKAHWLHFQPPCLERTSRHVNRACPRKSSLSVEWILEWHELWWIPPYIHPAFHAQIGQTFLMILKKLTRPSKQGYDSWRLTKIWKSSGKVGNAWKHSVWGTNQIEFYHCESPQCSHCSKSELKAKKLLARIWQSGGRMPAP